MDLDKIIKRGDTIYIKEDNGFMMVFVKTGVKYIDITMRVVKGLGLAYATGQGINLYTKMHPPLEMICRLSKHLFKTQSENPALKYIEL